MIPFVKACVSAAICLVVARLLFGSSQDGWMHCALFGLQVITLIEVVEFRARSLGEVK
ncbi:MAG: hypothetical protein ACU85V_00200 [Gammaproteobacteria bacterium]